MTLRFSFVVLSLAAAGALAVAFGDDSPGGASVKKPFDASLHTPASKTTSTQILYHGGPVMNSTNSVYVIYYGVFPSTTEPIINNFLTDLSGSAPYSVNSSYNAGAGTASIPVNYTFSQNTIFIDSGYSQGTQLGSSSVPKIVAHAINAGLVANANGVYLVVTSPDVKISGFCTSFCAYHNDTNVTLATGQSQHIRYALIPDPSQRCTGCNGGIAVYGDTTTPNGDMGADTMTDDIMHELSETVTDPDISAWYTQNGAEDGDLCNYVYGTPTNSSSPVQTVINKAGTYHYNFMAPSGHQYLIQLIWKNSGTGACAYQ